MVAPCGRGGAGRDGDAALADGGGLGADGLLIAVLTDLEFKGEIRISSMIFTNDFNCHVLKKAPEFLNWVLFAGEEQAQ